MTFIGDSIVTIAASLRNQLDLFHRIAGPKALVGLQGREVARVPAMSLDEQVGGAADVGVGDSGRLTRYRPGCAPGGQVIPATSGESTVSNLRFFN